MCDSGFLAHSSSVIQSMYSYQFQQTGPQASMVANPARGELCRENDFSLSPFTPENLASRDISDRPVPRQSAHSP